MALKHAVQVAQADNGTSAVSRNAWNADHAIDTDGLVVPAAPTDPAVPPPGSARLFTRTRAGRTMFTQQGPSGIDSWLQPHLGRANTVIFRPHGTTALTGLGFTLTATGTATAGTMATTNAFFETNRIEFTAASSTTSISGYRSAVSRWTRNLTAGRGGFFHAVRFGPATGTTASTRRMAVGLRNATAAMTDVQPSSLLNTIIAGYDAADTNIQIMHNDGTGVATKVDTGMPRPVGDRETILDLVIFAPPGSADVGVYLKNLTTGLEFSTTLTTDLPAPGTFLSEFGCVSAGGATSVTGFALFGLYTESDN